MGAAMGTWGLFGARRHEFLEVLVAAFAPEFVDRHGVTSLRGDHSTGWFEVQGGVAMGSGVDFA